MEVSRSHQRRQAERPGEPAARSVLHAATRPPGLGSAQRRARATRHPSPRPKRTQPNPLVAYAAR